MELDIMTVGYGQGTDDEEDDDDNNRCHIAMC